MARARKISKERRPMGPWILRIIKGGVIAALLGVMVLGIFVAMARGEIDSFEDLKASPNGQMIRVRAADGTVIQSEFEASYRQIPLNLAWAVTIHKSQGKTLKKARLDTGDGLWESGHAYTALSRLKSMEGLALTRPLTRGDFKTSQIVRGFLAKIKTETPDGSKS